MDVKNKIPFAMRNMALAAALAAVCTQAGAVLLVADGKLGLAGDDSLGSSADAFSEGYSSGWNVDYVDKNGKNLGTGQIWFGTDAAGHQFLYYKLPETYVDNTYGTNASAGWGKDGHTFNELLGSDSMGGGNVMQWTDQNAGGANNTARVDYIADCSPDPTHCFNNAGTTPGYRSAGVGTGPGVGTGAATGTNGGAASWDKMDVSLTGSAASILEIATSLEYNLKNVTGGPYDVNSPNLVAHPEWIKGVGYEFEFAAGTFDPTTFGTAVTVSSDGKVLSSPGLLFGDPHVSPPMGEKVTTFRPPCQIGDTNCVPEPSTPLLLAGGLAAMAWYARRRKENGQSDALRATVPS